MGGGGEVRRFVLIRDTDVSGISGKGVVVWGCQWPDGRVSYRWNTGTSTTCDADCIEHVEAIHGHGGATRVVWMDTEIGAQVWALLEGEDAGGGPSSQPVPRP